MGKDKTLATAIYEAIKNNNMPWRKTWHNGAETRPYNPITKTVYRGTNAMMLYFPIMLKVMTGEIKIPDYRYCTFKQMKKEGLSLKPESKGMPIFYWSSYLKESEKKNGKTEYEVKGYFKHYVVFNFSDMLIPEDSKHFKTECVFECDEPDIMEIITNLNIKVNTSNIVCPHYNRKTNEINIPDKFEDDLSLFTTLFHEITHWTKDNISSCKRELDRAHEELVAELGSFMVCHDLGIEYTPVETSNYYEYLKSWLSGYSTDEEKINALDEALIHANRAEKAILNALEKSENKD